MTIKPNFIERRLTERFVAEPDKADDPAVRGRYGTLSGVCGIICNSFLFVIKIIAGIFSHSAAICSDAFNNLSDCANCVVALLGCRIASKPADKAHPYGHGRAEYIASLIISVTIISMGLALLNGSVGKIFRPEPVNINIVIIILLGISVFIKLRMYLFNNRLGKRINSTVLIAAAKDSRSDAASTLTALLSVVLSRFSGFPFDGTAGALVSLLIIKSGVDIIRVIVDDILGKAVSPEILREIRDIVCADETVLGVHDIMIHSYGPSKMIGSCHAEFDESETFAAVHEHTDSIERRIKEKLNIDMTIHMDPVAVNDELTGRCRALLERTLEKIDSRLSCHDLRIASHGAKTALIFDLSVPDGLKYSEEELRSLIENGVKSPNEDFDIYITFEKSFEE